MIQLAQTQFVLRFYDEEYMAELLRSVGWENDYILNIKPEKLLSVDLSIEDDIPSVVVAYYNKVGHPKSDKYEFSKDKLPKIFRLIIINWFEQNEGK